MGAEVESEADRLAREEHARKYPEHAKLRLVVAESNAIGAFLEWLRENRKCVAKWVRVTPLSERRELVEDPKGIEALLADYFEIDTRKISAEKDAMLEEVRAANGNGSGRG